MEFTNGRTDKVINPFEWIINRFERIINTFERTIDPFERIINPFERISEGFFLQCPLRGSVVLQNVSTV